jgi:hypothetical protein
MIMDVTLISHFAELGLFSIVDMYLETSPMFFFDDMLIYKSVSDLYRHIDLVNMLVFGLNFKSCN